MQIRLHEVEETDDAFVQVAATGHAELEGQLFRAIADLDPNRGDVLLDSRERSKMSADEWRRLVALVPAERGRSPKRKR